MAFREMQYLVANAKALAAASGISISFSTTSNGTLLNDEIISFVTEEIDDFTISMDGKEEYTKLFKTICRWDPIF